MIPLCDLKQQYLSQKAEIDAAMQAVAERAHCILGPNVPALEQEVAAFCGCQHGVGVASGTDALHLSLRAFDIGPGDEVITTPFTFIATTEAIGMVGATPVFADIDPLTSNVDPNHIEAAITSRTKTTLLGQPVKVVDLACDMIRLSGLEVGHEIELAFTGIRPGEKLYEELRCDGEYQLPTKHNKILVAESEQMELPFLRKVFLDLEKTVDGPSTAIRDLLQNLVPQYQPLITNKRPTRDRKVATQLLDVKSPHPAHPADEILPFAQQGQATEPAQKAA